MSVSTSFGVEQQPSRSQRGRGTFYASENSSSTFRPLPPLADPLEYKRRARLNSYLFKIFPINGFQSSQTAIVENTSFADAMNRRDCPHPGTLASTESMSSLLPETQARPITPCVVSNLLYPVFKYKTPRIRLERGEELGVTPVTLYARQTGIYRHVLVHRISMTEISHSSHGIFS